MRSFPNFEPVSSLVLTVASWLTYRFLRRQIRLSGTHVFKNFVVIHTVKGFSIVSEAEVDIFMEFLCFLQDPMNVGNLISGSSAVSISSLYLWKFLVHVLLKPSLKEFEHNLASIWNEHKCTVISTFLGIALLWDWNENWSLQSCGHCKFSKFADISSAAL